MSFASVVRLRSAATHVVSVLFSAITGPAIPGLDQRSGQRSLAVPHASRIDRDFGRSAALLLVMAVLCLGQHAHAVPPLHAQFTAAQSVVPTSSLYYPYRVAVDASGNVYISNTEGNDVVKETLSQGVYTESVVVSSGLATPYGVAVDASGNVYVADNGHNRVLLETPSGGGYTQTVVTTTTSLSYPTGVTVDASGNLYIVNTGGGQVLKETPSEGSYTETVVGSGLDQCVGVAVDTNSNVYCSDIDDMAVYEFTYSAGSYTKSTVPTSGLNYPYDVAVDLSGNLYIADFANYRIVKETYISPGNYAQSVVPTYNLGGSLGLAVDASGNIYLADTFGMDIKELTLAGGSFGPVNVGSGAGPVYMLFEFAGGLTGATVAVTGTSILTQGATGLDYTDSGSGNCAAASYSAGDTCAIGVNFAPQYPGQRLGAAGLSGSSGLLAYGYIQGMGTGPQINYFYPPQFFSNDVISVAGSFSPYNLTNPFGAAVDYSGNVYIVDYNLNALYKETLSAGTYMQSTVATGLNNPEAVAVDGAGNVYICDSGNNQILLETNSGGSWAQSAIVTGLNFPTGLAVDALGNVYYSSFNDGAVYEVTQSGGVYSSPATVVTGLNEPRKIAVDASGNVYIADTGNSRVVKETLSAGSYTQSVIGSGMENPYGVGVAADGTVFVADTSHSRILAETWSDGSYTQSVFIPGPPAYDVQVDQMGNLIFPDPADTTVFFISYAQLPSPSFASTNIGSTSSDSPETVTITNVGNQPLTAVTPGLVVTGPNFVQVAGSGTPEDCGTGFSAAPLAPGASCNLSISFEPQAAGALTSTAVFTDNTLNVSPSGQTITLSGQGVAVSTTTTASSATAPFNSSAQNVTLTATVTSNSGTVNAGSVTFWVSNGGTAIGMPVTSATLTNGTVSVSYGLPASVAVGAYTINTTYNAGGSFTGSTGSAQTLTVTKAAPAVSLASSANPALVNNAITLTATVSSSAGTPTGAVSFLDGTTLLGSGTLSASTATYTTSGLAVGSHSITAVYGGDSDFLTVTSSALAEVIAKFTLVLTSGSSGTQTVAPGQAATYSFTIQAQTTALTTPVVFSARGLPSGASATFDPPSITPGLTASTLTMTIQTAQRSATASVVQSAQVHRDLLALGLAPFMLGMLLLPCSGTIRRAARGHGRKLSLLFLLVMATALGGLAGCGYSSGKTSTAPQSYTITVVGTYGTTSQTINVNLTVQ
jgi:sugar lactone lactonase YvrE